MIDRIETITKDISLMRDLNSGHFYFLQYFNDGTTQESCTYETREEALLSYRMKEIDWHISTVTPAYPHLRAGKDHGLQTDISGNRYPYETIPSKTVAATLQMFQRHYILVNRMGHERYRHLMTIILCDPAVRSSFR